MAETPKEKVEKQKEELEILTEIPTTIKIGEEDFRLKPLAIGKVKILGDVVFGIFSKIDAFGKVESKDPEEFKKLLIDNWSRCIEDIITGVQVVLSNGRIGLDELEKNEAEREFLRWEFNTEHLHAVAEFILKSVNLKGLLKNVAPLRGM